LKKLLALDLDGTVVGPGPAITDAVVAAVERAHAAGLAVTVITGRMYAAAKPFIDRLNLRGPVVCYQGAAIFDARSGAVLQRTPVQRDVAREVLEAAVVDRIHAQCYADDRLYLDAINEWSRVYIDLAKVEPVIVPSLVRAFADRDTDKIVLVDSPERASRYVDILKDRMGDRAYVTRSNPEFVEVLDPRVSKGTALAFVAAHYGIELGDTIAVGDSWNDLPLLDAAGFGIAMGSGPPELLARADAVVADVMHDGVVEAIERYALH